MIGAQLLSDMSEARSRTVLADDLKMAVSEMREIIGFTAGSAPCMSSPINFVNKSHRDFFCSGEFLRSRKV